VKFSISKMTKYSNSYHPAAPVAEIIIRSVNSETPSMKVSMLVDTGSDVTLIPRSACHEIGIKVEDRSLELIGFDGSKSKAFYVFLDLIFLNKLFRGDFLVYDETEGIIGRDLLNEFKIVFDGPRLDWKMLKTNSESETV
jgi:hypothetical protein